MFLTGLRSDMTGSKAVNLERWAARAAAPFLRFDYTGHGDSSGAFADGCVGDWADDAYQAIDALTAGPLVLVGSSLGGWIALLLAKRFAAEGAAARVVGMVGVAAAPDFTADSMEPQMSAAQRAALAADGFIETPSDYADEPLIITRRLIEDGAGQLVLRTPLELPFPVRLLHGDKDADVPLSVGLRLLGHMRCPDARLVVIKDGDHRLSEPRELALLDATVEEVRRLATPA